MPYPKAHLYVLALIPFVILGFWPGYFSDVGSAPIGFHIHGVSATLWIFLLTAQSWSIHNKQRNWHRKLGLFSLLLFPVFVSGFFMVLQTRSQIALQAEHPARVALGMGITSITVIAIIAAAYLYFAGLKNRNNFQLHARYMLSIPFLFSESVFGRVFNSHMPGLIVNGVEDIPLVYWAFHLSEVLAIAFAMYLYMRERRYGQPFLIVSVAMVLQSIALESFGQVGWWRDILLAITGVSVVSAVVAGIVAGMLVAWLGWTAPRRHQVQHVAVKQ